MAERVPFMEAITGVAGGETSRMRCQHPPITLRVSYAVSGTDVGYTATRRPGRARRVVPYNGGGQRRVARRSASRGIVRRLRSCVVPGTELWLCSYQVLHTGSVEATLPSLAELSMIQVESYAFATACPVLTERMVISASASATGCPRMALPACRARELAASAGWDRGGGGGGA
eukprot:2835916-Rhodomonas_salina.1